MTILNSDKRYAFNTALIVISMQITECWAEFFFFLKKRKIIKLTNNLYVIYFPSGLSNVSLVMILKLTFQR